MEFCILYPLWDTGDVYIITLKLCPNFFFNQIAYLAEIDEKV